MSFCLACNEALQEISAWVKVATVTVEPCYAPVSFQISAKPFIGIRASYLLFHPEESKDGTCKLILGHVQQEGGHLQNILCKHSGCCSYLHILYSIMGKKMVVKYI